MRPGAEGGRDRGGRGGRVLILLFGLLHDLIRCLAATQPTLSSGKTPDQVMEQAEKQYKDVLAQAGAIPSTLTARARFGLAAIAENRHDFDGAKAHYEAIQKDSSLGPALTEQARYRLNMLKEVQKERVIGRARPKEELRATTGPTTGPTTNPYKVSI